MTDYLNIAETAFYIMLWSTGSIMLVLICVGACYGLVKEFIKIKKELEVYFKNNP